MSLPTAATAGGRSGGSTSMVSVETATGWHVFKVQGYSHYKATTAVGTAVSSAAFSVGGHSWRIQYFPCGYTGEANAGWVCFGLHLVAPAAAAVCGGGGAGAVKASITLGLLDKDGAPPPSVRYRRVSGLRDFAIATTGCKQWHFRQFIRSQTLDLLYLEADCFSIRCDVTVVTETRDESSVEPPPPDLHRHLGSILASGVGGDVTFEVGKETFVAHKTVLAARSPVFMAEFFGGMLEAEEKQAGAARVRILGIHARVFKAMLHFIYTDSLPAEIDDDGDEMVMAQHLLVAADRYDIQRLKVICENKLCAFVNARVVATTLVLAEQLGCRRLEEACFKFLKYRDNFKPLGYADYSYLTRSCPSFLNEFLAQQGL